MAKIKVSSITKGNSVSSAAPCPPPFFKTGPCCCTSQIVDNITVLSTTPETLDVVDYYEFGPDHQEDGAVLVENP